VEQVTLGITSWVRLPIMGPRGITQVPRTVLVFYFTLFFFLFSLLSLHTGRIAIISNYFRLFRMFMYILSISPYGEFPSPPGLTTSRQLQGIWMPLASLSCLSRYLLIPNWVKCVIVTAAIRVGVCIHHFRMVSMAYKCTVVTIPALPIPKFWVPAPSPTDRC
jgi:hypothetical protein